MEADGRDWTHLSQVHFGAAALGDARRSRRLVKTAELIFKSPAGSLPDKLPEWADLMGLYRLASAAQVTHQAVIEPHRQWTLQQMRQATPLSFNEPPGLQAVDLPGCEAYVRDKACPLDRFVEIARAAIDPGCVSIKP